MTRLSHLLRLWHGSAAPVCLLAVLVNACSGGPEAPPAEPVVTVEGGEIRGRYENGVNRFLGIPYAQPPVRDLRWKPPQPPGTWGGVRSAQAFGADCMQHRTPTAQPQSEDCLFVNVWAPVEQPQPLSVMVWIHGGGLASGSAALPVFDGAALARRGVVLVSFNYRLGRFGFFAHPALTRDDTGGLLGNYGFMDQMAALLWVQRNISAFSGNPDDVTVFGESAGGRSVHALLTSPLAAGLFHKAIIQSGAGLPRMRDIRAEPPRDTPVTPDPDRPVNSETTGEELGAAFAASAGLEDPTSEELRALPGLLVRGEKGNVAPVFPDAMIDGQIVRADFDESYRQARQSRVPVLIGANSMEALSGDEPLVGEAALFSSLGEDAADGRALYDGYGTDNEALIALEMEGDRRQVSGTRRHARLLAQGSEPVFLYHFAYVADERRNLDPGARHGSELALVFDTLHTVSEPSAADAQVAELVAGYWVQFAKTGDPNHEGSPPWPPYSDNGNELLEFTDQGTAETRSNFEGTKLDFWDRLDAAGWRYVVDQPAAAASEADTPASSQTSSSSPQ